MIKNNIKKLQSKICGVTDIKTLNYLVNHSYPPSFIGFIVNYKKSKRYLDYKKLKKLLKVKKKKVKFVAVLVKPTNIDLKNIAKLPFDYYQIYNTSPKKIKIIKNKYKKKIIVALTINKKKDVEKYKLYKKISDIFLFDGKGYEKSISFNHKFINNLKTKTKIMLAGNIKPDDNLKNFVEIANIIDISGGLETYGKKDISKINIFLNNIKKINYEN